METPTPKPGAATYQRVLEAVRKHPTYGRGQLAAVLGISENTVRVHLNKARSEAGTSEVFAQGQAPKTVQPEDDTTLPSPPPAAEPRPFNVEDALPTALRMLQRSMVSPITLASALGCSQMDVWKVVEGLKEAQHNVTFSGHLLALDKPGFGHINLDLENDGGWRSIGLCGDTHLCSHQERLDALHAYYDLLEAEGIEHVFHAGNIVDGHIHRINGASLFCTTVDDQIYYTIDNYPSRAGITTHFITGDDHEGWWIKDGINFGSFLQKTAEEEGRKDLHYIGHVEADVNLVAGPFKAIMKVQHPGGGSAYARSYTGQKQVECVPLESEILTKEGWKRYDELTIGEPVLGYDIGTNTCQWTPVFAVHTGEGELLRYSNDQFSVVCTENHNWAQEIEQRAGPNKNSRVPAPYSRRYRELAPLGHTTRRARIIQTAKAPDGPGLGGMNYGDFLDRAGAVQRVLQMTSGERRAFVEGLLLGEGTRAIIEGRSHQQLVFSQNTGPVLDAFRLACFLEGISTNERRARGGSFKPEVDHHRRVTVSTKQTRIVNRLKKEAAGTKQVWCPTTALGTWVMRQGHTITITGNSFQGGEKPAILAQGHYHVSNYMIERNVHVISLPGFQDQTIFARKKRLRMEVGGAILRFKQNPQDGAITRLQVEFKPFFDRGYYQRYLRSDKQVINGKIVSIQ